MHTLFPAHNIYFIDLPLLILLISLVYSATRFEEWGSILREALRWGLRLVAFLVAIGIVLYVLDRLT
jgi:integral membrane sensor domain MASE1